MIGAQVKPSCNFGMECLYCFELERTDLENHHIEVLAFSDGFCEGETDVSTRHGPDSTLQENMSAEFGGGCFSVCSCNGDDRASAFLKGQLQFSNDRDSFGDDILD